MAGLPEPSKLMTGGRCLQVGCEQAVLKARGTVVVDRGQALRKVVWGL
jgi:hypothetical protein